MQIKKSIILFALICFFIFTAHVAWSASYDIYVDKSYDGDEEGTSDKPYKKIEAALEKVDSKGKKIYIKNGTYSEHFILPKGVELYGQDKSKTIIKGGSGSATIALKDNNSLKNLTIQEGSAAISVEGKAEISNCIIKNASKKGVDMIAGNSELKITDSKITGNAKGFYAQKGSKLHISDSEVSGNKEEGIDIREKTSGSIIGNYIGDNGEGGIEVVVGSSDFLIKNNQIKKNKASGIAAQFYSQASKTGKIEIKNNTIASNGAYGLVCKAPSGGDPAKDYWNDSIELIDNKIDKNKGKSISGSCKIIKAITEEEANKNQAIESATSQTNPEMTAEEKAIELEEQRIMELLEKERYLDNLIEEMELNQGGASNKLDSNLNNIKERSKIKNFFLGKDLAGLKTAKESLDEVRQEKSLLEEAVNQISEEGISGSKENGLRIIGQLNDKIAYGENLILEKENKFSLFDWFLKLFNKI